LLTKGNMKAEQGENVDYVRGSQRYENGWAKVAAGYRLGETRGKDPAGSSRRSAGQHLPVMLAEER